MDEVTDLIDRQIAEGLCTGAQIAKATGTGLQRQVHTWTAGVDGIGQTIEESSLSAIYCASKPLLAFAMHAMSDAGTLHLGEPVGPILGAELVGAPDATISDLLNHTAGVHTGDSGVLKLHGFERKRAIARGASPPDGWSSENRAAYSEYAAWSILADVIEATMGQPWTEAVNALVVDPADVRSEVMPVIERSSYRTTIHRIRINIDLRDRPTPLLNERGPTFACEPNPGYGAYASARGLATIVHTHLLDRRLRRATLADPGSRRGYRWDETMQARVDTQNGLLADLASYGVVGASVNSIGHTGLMGLTTVIHEPHARATLAITYYGLIDGPTATQVRRPPLLPLLLA